MFTRRLMFAGLALAPLAVVGLALAAYLAARAAEPVATLATGTAGPTAHDFGFAGIDGAPLDLGQFRGRPMLVVNTASRCGFTYQYDALQKLYDTYRDRGLVVIGVPSNDFRQELADAAAVKNFCEVNFNIDFPLTDITAVRGPGAHPFYAWAAKTLGPDKAPGWNFHKYLVGPDGRLVASFGTGTEPMAPAVRAAIEALLPQG